MPLRSGAWPLVVLALGCSSTEEQAAPTTPADVVSSCASACQRISGCSPPVAPFDCVSVCAVPPPPADAGIGCGVTAKRARYDQCGLLECSHIGSCLTDVTNSCSGSSGGMAGTGGAGTG